MKIVMEKHSFKDVNMNKAVEKKQKIICLLIAINIDCYH